MFQDIRYAVRFWANRPWQTGFAVAVLAIAIGANTGVFSVVNALLLHSLPFRQPDRLALVHDFIPPHESAQQFHDWPRQSTYLSDAALFEEIDVNLGGTRLASRVHLAQTSWNFFSVLGTQPVLGRGFASEDEVDAPGFGLPGRNAVAVIGYGLWQQLFGADRKVLGAIVRIDGHPLTVIGVAPPGFDFPGKAAVWKPAAFSPGNNGWSTIARLKPDVSWAQARAALAIEAKHLSPAQESPNIFHPSITSLQDALAGSAKNPSLIFMGAVLLVLLIACTNVANILTARTADRIREFSVRSALGASDGRLARQLFTECLLLSLVATLAGFAVAYWTTSIAARVDSTTLNGQSFALLDLRVLGFTVFISVLTALTFGILPFLYVRRVHKFTTRSSSPPSGSRLVREVLVGAQVTLTVVLLAGSVSLGRSFVHLMKTDRGYNVNDVVTVSVSLEGTRYELDKRQLPYFEQVLDRVRRLPGVRTASATEFLPLYATAFVGGPFGIDGHVAARNSTMIPVMSGYFQTMGGRILYGREFTDAEVRSGAKVAVVNERFATEFDAAENAVGHQLTIADDSPRRIIGVVKGMEYETDATLANGKQVFIPSATPGSFFSTFVVRVDGRAENHLAQVRDAIQAVDPQVPIFGVKTMQQRFDELFAGPRFYRTAVWFFAGFVLLLSIIGVYGIVSYAVIQRTPEMAIRMALGTTPIRLRGMLLRQGLLIVAAGAIAGTLGAQLSARFLEALINGAKPIDLLTSAGLILILILVASMSVWSASRPIRRFDIAAILRSE
ncbi:MAG TPA: ABC transporter permease [Terriglobales bacterium]|nr:ABC transporter permease [Terriglobales bacterium]